MKKIVITILSVAVVTIIGIGAMTLLSNNEGASAYEDSQETNSTSSKYDKSNDEDTYDVLDSTSEDIQTNNSSDNEEVGIVDTIREIFVNVTNGNKENEKDNEDATQDNSGGQTVKEDTIAPVLTLPYNNITIEKTSSFVLTDELKQKGMKALDNIDGDITDEIELIGDYNSNEVGTYEVTYSVSDSSNNTTEKNVVLNVVDNATYDSNPVLILTDTEVEIYKDSTFDYKDYIESATDALGNDIKSAVYADSLDTNNLGQKTVMFTAVDIMGNESYEFLVVNIVRNLDSLETLTPEVETVEPTEPEVPDRNTEDLETLTPEVELDTTAPVLTLTNNELTVLSGSVFNSVSYIKEAYDTQGTETVDLIDNVTVEGEVNTAKAGNYTLTYRLTDGANTTEKTLTVYVIRDIDNLETLTPEVNTVEPETPDRDIEDLETLTPEVDTVEPTEPEVPGRDVDNLETLTPEVDTVEKRPVLITLSKSGSETVEYGEVIELPTVVSVQDSIGRFIPSEEVHIDYTGFMNTGKDSLGTYKLTYTYEDVYGETTTVYYEVTVQDTIAPELTVPAEVEVNEDTSFTAEDYATSVDNYDGNITDTIEITESTVNINEPGKYHVDFKSTDGQGNSSTATMKVEVLDITTPELKLSTDSVSLEANKTSVDLNSYIVSAIDNADGDLKDKVTITGNFDSNKAGEYVVTYSVIDLTGNSTSKSIVFNIMESEAPVINLSSTEVTIVINQNFNASDYLISAIDNFDGDITTKVNISGTVDNMKVTSEESPNVITYSVKDTAGYLGEATLLVNVEKDKVKPEINLSTDSVTVEYGTEVNPMDYVVNVTDNIDGNIFDKLIVNPNTVDSSLGVKSITYTVTDTSGNTTEKSITVTIQDKTAPVIVVDSSDVEVEFGGTFTAPEATATDNHDGSLEVSVSNPVNTSKAGVYNVTYTATDSSGNTTTITKIVTVKEEISLEIDGFKLISEEESGNYYLRDDAGQTAYQNKFKELMKTVNDESVVSIQLNSVTPEMSLFEIPRKVGEKDSCSGLTHQYDSTDKNIACFDVKLAYNATESAEYTFNLYKNSSTHMPNLQNYKYFVFREVLVDYDKDGNVDFSVSLMQVIEM